MFDLADRISVMLHGQLVGTVNKTDVTTDEVLAMIIMGKLPERSHAEGPRRAPQFKSGGERGIQGTSGRGSDPVKFGWLGIFTVGNVCASMRSDAPIMPFCASK